MNDTAIIFGCGASIRHYSKVIPFLVNNFTTLAINRFSIKFSELYEPVKTDYLMWLDKGFSQEVVNYYKGEKLIVNGIVGDLDVLTDNNIPVYQSFTHSDVVEINNTGKLYGISSTVIPAVNWFLTQGFKRIYLFGIDNTKNWEHFYPSGQHKKSIVEIIKINEQLKELSKHIDVYSNSRNLELKEFKMADLYNEMEYQTLKDEATKRGLKPKSNKKADLIKALVESDGVQPTEKVETTTMLHPHVEEGTLFLDEPVEVKDFKFEVPTKHVGSLVAQGFKVVE